MNHSYIFIDDTGVSGNESNSSYISQSAVTWAAIILNYENKKEIEELIGKLLIVLQKEYEISEFHFKDIYGGRNKFKGVSPEIRLDIFKFFVELYNKYKPKVLATSIDENTLTNTGYSDEYKNYKIDGFAFNKPKDYALFLLLLKCKEYIENNSIDYELPIEIVIDEGRQKENTKQKVDELLEICEKGEINYCSSASTLLLQFADFIAFSLNRIQTNCTKNRKPFDEQFMMLIGQLEWNTNLPLIKIDASDMDSLDADSYDKHIVNILETMVNPSKELIEYSEFLAAFIMKMENEIKRLRYKNKKEKKKRKQ